MVRRMQALARSSVGVGRLRGGGKAMFDRLAWAAFDEASAEKRQFGSPGPATKAASPGNGQHTLRSEGRPKKKKQPIPLQRRLAASPVSVSVGV